MISGLECVRYFFSCCPGCLPDLSLLSWIFFSFIFLKDRFSAQKLAIGVMGRSIFGRRYIGGRNRAEAGAMRDDSTSSDIGSARRRLGGWSDRQDPIWQIWR